VTAAAAARTLEFSRVVECANSSVAVLGCECRIVIKWALPRLPSELIHQLFINTSMPDTPTGISRGAPTRITWSRSVR